MIHFSFNHPFYLTKWIYVRYYILYHDVESNILYFSFPGIIHNASLFDYMMFCTMKYKDDLMNTPIN